MKKKRVLFLYSGGTIGQIPRLEEVNGGQQWVLYPPENEIEFKGACDKILADVKEAQMMDITFELVTSKDSTNMTPADWTILAKRIQRAQDDEVYDAVGIAHGTDTLAYTASALAFALHGSDAGRSGLNIPIVLTGAQNTVHVTGGDASFNIQNAFRVLDKCLECGVADVLVSFWSRVLLGCRTVKVSEREFDAFQSPGFPDVGTINSLGIMLRPDLLKKKSEATFSLTLAPDFSDTTFSFELSPGARPEMLMTLLQHETVSAVILKSLAESNVPTEGAYNFLPAIKTISEEKNIPVIITSRFIGGYVGHAHYEVGLLAIRAGGIPTYNHTSIAAEVKARWLIGNNICESVDGFRKAYLTSYAGEVSL